MKKKKTMSIKIQHSKMLGFRNYQTFINYLTQNN
jgi:hypothetical protein